MKFHFATGKNAVLWLIEILKNLHLF